MPTYSYRCTECGEAFDIQQAFTDDTLSVCPNCGGQLRKLFNNVGVTFNGSGFYRTDSRAKAAAGASNSSGSGGGGGSSEGSASSAPSESSSSSSSPAPSAAPATTSKKE